MDAVLPDQQVPGGASPSARRSWRRNPIGPARGPGITLGPLTPAIDGDTDSLQVREGRRSIARSGLRADDARRRIRRSRRSADEYLAAGDRRGRCARSASSTTRCSGCGSTSRRSAPWCCAPSAMPRPCWPSTRRWHAHAFALAGPRDRRPHPPHVEARGPHLAQLLCVRSSRATRFAGTLVRAGAGRRSRLHARRPTTRRTPFALSPMNGGAYPMSNGLSAPAGPLPRRAGAGREGAGARRPLRRAEARSTPAWCSPRPTTSTGTTRCGWRSRSARGLLARRAHRHGGQPPLRRAGDDGDEDLRPPHRLAELDLPAPQRRRRERAR